MHRHPPSRRLAWLLSLLLALAAATGVTASPTAGTAGGDVYGYLSGGLHRASQSPWSDPAPAARVLEGEGTAVLTGGLSVALTRHLLLGLAGTVFSVADGTDASAGGSRYGIHIVEATAEGVLVDAPRLRLTVFGGGGPAVVDHRRHLAGFLPGDERSTTWSGTAGLRAVLRGLRTVPLPNLSAFLEVRYRSVSVDDVSTSLAPGGGPFEAGGGVASAGLVYWWHRGP